MTYVKSYTAWQDDPDHSTPVTAAKLQNMDDGIAGAVSATTALSATAVSLSASTVSLSASTVALSASTVALSASYVALVAATSAWTVSNVTTDRTYDANSTTLDELADALGTLIADLKTKSILT